MTKHLYQCTATHYYSEIETNRLGFPEQKLNCDIKDEFQSKKCVLLLFGIACCKNVLFINCNTIVLIVLLTNLDIVTSALQFRTKHESCDRNLGEKYVYYLALKHFQQSFSLVDNARSVSANYGRFALHFS